MLNFETANTKTFDSKLQEDGERLTVVYFWGSPCPNCDNVDRAWQRIRAALSPAQIRWINVDAYKESDLSRRFGLYGVPTFVLFHQGRAIGKVTGFQNEKHLLSVIKDQLAKLGLERAA